MQVGLGKLPLTCPLPVQLAGFGVERYATGVGDQLYARALVAEHDGQAAALVSCDLLWLERRDVARVRERVAQQTGLDPQAIMIACTHTHSGPDTLGWYEHAPVDEAWMSALIDQIASAVYLAHRDLRPATLERFESQVELGVNRRHWRPEKGIAMSPNETGPIDHTLTALRIRDADGVYLGGVFHHATHPVCLGPKSTLISGDWCGVAEQTVESVLGGVCLFVNGACGDINPRAWVGQTYAGVTRAGRRAAGAAIELLCRLDGEPVEALATARAEVEGESKPHPYLTLPQERRTAEDGGIVMEAQALRLGPATFISAPGECLTETASQIRDRVGSPVLVASFTNDYIGYLPLPHIYEEGGYEPGASMLTADGVKPWIDAAVEVAEQVR